MKIIGCKRQDILASNFGKLWKFKQMYSNKNDIA